MSLQRDRKAEREEKMIKTKERKQSGYDDNNISVNINIGSEDQIKDSYNPSKVSLPPPEEKKIVDDTDKELLELKSLIQVFKEKKKKLIDSKIDIPDEIFDLPKIEIKSKADIEELILVIKDKMNQLDKVTEKPTISTIPAMLPEQPISRQPPDVISRPSPFGFPMMPQAVPQFIPQERLAPIGEVTDYVKDAEKIFSELKSQSDGALKTENQNEVLNALNKSNISVTRLQQLKNRETDNLKKNKIQDIITSTYGIRSDLNIKLRELQDSQTKPPEDKQPEDKPPEDKQPEDKQPEDKQPEDKQPEDKQPEDKPPEDKQPEDKQPEDKQPEDKPPEDKTRPRIQERIDTLNNYKSKLVRTGRSPNGYLIVEKQINDLLKLLNMAKDKGDTLTSQEEKNALSIIVDMDNSSGLFPPAKALRNIRPDLKLSKIDKLELKLYDNPDLPPNALKQYKVYVTDTEIKSARGNERLFNKDGDLYARIDLEGPAGQIIPEDPPAGEQDPSAGQRDPSNTWEEMTDTRRNTLQTYRNSLYHTGRADIDNAINTLNAEIETALGDPNAYTTMDLTNGNVALAVAVKNNSTKNPRDISGVFFQLLGGTGATDPSFYLYIDNQEVRNQYGQPKLFNRYGGPFISKDYSGWDPVLSYPFRPSSGRDELSTP